MNQTWHSIFSPAYRPTAASGTVVFEARADAKGVRYLIGCDAAQTSAITQLVTSQVDDARFSFGTRRAEVNSAARVRVSHHSLALSTDRVMAAVRSVLAGLAAAKAGHGELVLQVILGPRVAPAMLSDRLDDPRASWLDLIMGTVRPASAETRASMRDPSWGSRLQGHRPSRGYS